ncbi:MAG: PrsW family glutamic-type intramembrane protease [Candidatus Campbellbacteria bacterium]|nr:PrsW family glutamic-type intramembrane protease [Candidatus Campbellbacteria bacterium]
MDTNTILTALLFGLVPTFIWLVFWLSEDRAHPEPKRMIFLSFIAGMIAVPISITIEAWIDSLVSDGFSKTLLWSLTEEMAKYLLAFIIVLRSIELDEALDALIYMICVALGFAALENTLYALEPILDQEHIGAATVSNLRFVGATLLHTVSSAAIGVAMALSYYRSRASRMGATVIGLIVAIGLHALFNFFIINLSENTVFMVFAGIWILTIGLIVIAEKIKKIDAGYSIFK